MKFTQLYYKEASDSEVQREEEEIEEGEIEEEIMRVNGWKEMTWWTYANEEINLIGCICQWRDKLETKTFAKETIKSTLIMINAIYQMDNN